MHKLWHVYNISNYFYKDSDVTKGSYYPQTIVQTKYSSDFRYFTITLKIRLRNSWAKMEENVASWSQKIANYCGGFCVEQNKDNLITLHVSVFRVHKASWLELYHHNDINRVYSAWDWLQPTFSTCAMFWLLFTSL